jgi:hypothetical protein
VLQKVPVGSGAQWCNTLAEYVRQNDRAILDSCDRALNMFETELLPCETFDDFLDVIGESTKKIMQGNKIRCDI